MFLSEGQLIVCTIINAVSHINMFILSFHIFPSGVDWKWSKSCNLWSWSHDHHVQGFCLTSNHLTLMRMSKCLPLTWLCEQLIVINLTYVRKSVWITHTGRAENVTMLPCNFIQTKNCIQGFVGSWNCWNCFYRMRFNILIESHRLWPMGEVEQISYYA